MTVEEVTAAGLAAATAVAAGQGLPAGQARIRSARGNLMVHLAPSPVVARVATFTAFSRRDPFAWLEREVAVAGFGARQGGPLVAPAAGGVDPGPHRHAGFAISLWTYLPSGPREPAGPDSAGRALGLLHRSLAGYPRPLPWLLPATEQISDGLAALEREKALEVSELSALRTRQAGLMAVLDGASEQAIVLHGDAHAGNLLPVVASGAGTDAADATEDRWAWIDLEETCRRPREWDLAVLAGGWPAADDAAAALAAYAAVTGTAIPTAAMLAPFARVRELEAAVWALCMACQYPARYRRVAQDLLARVRSG